MLPYLVMLRCVVYITYRFWRFGELKLKVGRGQRERGAAMANRFPLLAILRRRHSQSLSHPPAPYPCPARLDSLERAEVGPPVRSPLWLPAEEIEEISRLDQVHQAGGEAIDGDRAGAAPGG